MTTFVPSTRITVLRGSGVDSFGDETDVDTEVAEKMPAAITQDRQRSYQQVEARGGVVETFTIRLRPGADVTEGDRFRDETSGHVYQVREVSNPPRLIGLPDVRVTAVRVGAQS